MPKQWIFYLTATIEGLMESIDGTSIQTNRLECTWKVEMKGKDSIKGGGVSEKWGPKKFERKDCSILESNL